RLQHETLLGSAASGGNARLLAVRFWPLDAGQRDVSVQETVGCASAAIALASLGARSARRACRTTRFRRKDHAVRHFRVAAVAAACRQCFGAARESQSAVVTS